jgi:hypothetical protein
MSAVRLMAAGSFPAILKCCNYIFWMYNFSFEDLATYNVEGFSTFRKY